MKSVAILMTCYNRQEQTLQCLRSIGKQRCNVNMTVFLVDDGSSDGTVNAVTQFAKSAAYDIHIILGSGELYWCRGMRLAWETALSCGKFDYYLWLNDDVRMNDDALVGMLHDSKSLNDNGIIAGACSGDDDFKKPTYGLCDKQFKLLRPCGSLQLGWEWLNGNCVLIPDKVFQSVGLIYGGYHHAYGDHDYGYAAMRKGIGVYLSSAYVGICKRDPSRYHHLSGKRLIERLKLLASPKGYNLHDAIVYKYRRVGFLGAALTAVHVLFIVIFKPMSGARE